MISEQPVTLMLPSVGEACMFKFIGNFSKYDGIYQVLGIVSFDDVLIEDDSAIEKLYTECECPDGEYQKDYVHFREDKIFKLIHVETDDIYFFPSLLLKYVPDHNVHPFKEIGFIVNTGVFDSTLPIDTIRKDIEEMLVSRMGIVTEVIPLSIKTKWMTNEEYLRNHHDTREYAKTLPDTIANNVTLLDKASKQIEHLQGLVDHYEQLIISKGLG